MVQSIQTKQQIIREKLDNLTLSQQEKVLEFINFLQYQNNQSKRQEIYDVSNDKDILEERISFAEDAQEYIGCVEGRENLSQMKQKLKKEFFIK